MHALAPARAFPRCLGIGVGPMASLQAPKEGKDYHFPAEEEAILAFWASIDAFKEQLRRTEGKPEFSFYDGPPFATGLPHYGHLLAGTLKVRGAAPMGMWACAPRGWCTHGLGGQGRSAGGGCRQRLRARPCSLAAP